MFEEGISHTLSGMVAASVVTAFALIPSLAQAQAKGL